MILNKLTNGYNLELKIGLKKSKYLIMAQLNNYTMKSTKFNIIWKKHIFQEELKSLKH